MLSVALANDDPFGIGMPVESTLRHVGSNENPFHDPSLWIGMQI